MNIFVGNKMVYQVHSSPGLLRIPRHSGQAEYLFFIITNTNNTSLITLLTTRQDDHLTPDVPHLSAGSHHPPLSFF